ncbi:hypothetical protein IJH02_03420 [Candidatus Saccharibacteria bacterium]|nr:hypothetical protein [Candidatus Saccharibacteria bacterium]
MGGKKLGFGRNFMKTCIFMFAPLLTMMLLPSVLVDPTTAEDTIENEVPSSEASLSASLRFKIENYLPTDEKTLTITTDNGRGYRISTTDEDDREVWSIIPEYTEDKRTFYDISYLQEMTAAICDATPTPRALLDDGEINANVPETTLIDARDNTSYTVRKLADGKCWMAQNLRYNFSAGKVLTSRDTNIKSDLVIPENTQTEAGISWGTDQPSESEVNIFRSYSSHNAEYGNYYNWFAATAGTGKYYTPEKTTTQSICPKGWQLPKTVGARSFKRLIEVYELTNDGKDVTLGDLLTDAPISFVASGNYYNDGIVAGQGEWGDYWTADAANIVAASFDIETGEMNYNHKNMGFSVRCVAK